MIISFKDRETKRIFEGIISRKLPTEIQRIARRKLIMIDNSFSINDLRIPPSNRLEKLKGEFSEFYSIRINDQWRIIFIWKEGCAKEVQIIDYH